MHSFLRISFLLLSISFGIKYGKVAALVTVEPVSDNYWGYDGDEELVISVNVTTDASWDMVSVTVQTPDNQTLDSITDDDSNSTSKIFTYTLRSLFIGEAGEYTFLAEEDPAGTDEATVTVYVYTMDVDPPTANYHVVERETALSMYLYVVTSGSWDDVTVTSNTPGGDSIPTSFSPTELDFWRIYQANVDDAVEGTYNFTAVETLGGRDLTLTSNFLVEVHESSFVDEYLYRIGQISSAIISQIPDFHEYIFDGSDGTHIRDGGDDMYDKGNYLTVTANTVVYPNIPYGKPSMQSEYTFSSKSTYPFTWLMWISNDDNAEYTVSLEVTGTTGTIGTGDSVQFNSTFTRSSYTVWYEAAQIYNASPHPSICEVYFYITNEGVWSSTSPSSARVDVGGSPPQSLDNSFTVAGSPQNTMLGYMLLSKTDGKETIESEVTAALTSIVNSMEQKDGFTITSQEFVELEANAPREITITSRLTYMGDWENVEVTIMTPSGNSSVVSSYVVDGTSRIYQYEVTEATEQSAGIYTFSATDEYNYMINDQTELRVYTATVTAAQEDYYGVNKDPELVIEVTAFADDWTDATVMVTRPDGSVTEAMTESTASSGDRTYTHRITNLFVEDAGKYSFTVERNGLPTSRPANVTVYLFSIEVSPDKHTSHSVRTETKALIAVSVVCDGDWANVNGVVRTPAGETFTMTSTPGSLPFIRGFEATVDGATEGDYEITISETLGGRTESRTSIETIIMYNATHLDEYLYRIGLMTDEISSYIDGWQDYMYDGPDNTYIKDGGFDMYDRGNYVSYKWSTGEEIDVPYGKPFEYNETQFSSKSFYPFVTLMWIDNTEKTEEEFSIEVKGTSSASSSAVIEQYERILFEGTYFVNLHVYQINDTSKPSICEVYFLISSTYEWNSSLPDNFEVNVGGTPPQNLLNTARITGSPSNVMLGYTLLSKSNGGSVSYLEVEKVVERYVAIIAERDQFSVRPTSDDGYYVANKGESLTVDATVRTSGGWDGITVEVETPSGARIPITEYDLDPLHTLRIYRYPVEDAENGDSGKYIFRATDKYNEIEETVATVFVFTMTAGTSQTQYAGDSDDTVVMEIFTTSDSYVSSISVEIETPTLGTVPVTDWTDDWTEFRTWRHKVINPTYETDNGNYTFKITEKYFDYTFSRFISVDLKVFSVAVSVPETSLTANANDEVLQLSALVSTLGDWGAVEVRIYTPRGIYTVTEYDPQTDLTKRTYIHTIREVSTRDAGSYVFVLRESYNGEYRQIESEYIEVIIKEEKLNGGEIAGIVIGSVAGAAILIGLLWYCCVKRNSSKPPTTEGDITIPEKGAKETTEQKKESPSDNMTSL